MFSPKKLISRLGLKSNWNVLELGCGPGYFSPFVAQALTEGHLWVVDVQEEMVRQARKRLGKRKVSNATTCVVRGGHLPFAANTFDCAFLVSVLGEIEDPSLTLPEVFRVLKPGARLSITELAGDPDALSVARVQALVGPFGFATEKALSR